MASGDAAWLHMDRPVNELVVNAVLWFAGPLDHDALRAVLDERLVDRFPQFRQRVEDDGRRAWWVDVDAVDLDDHLTCQQLSAPGGLGELHEHVNRLIATPLPRDRPLWQVTLIDGYKGGSALVARMHHCIADGVALFQVLLSLSDEARDVRPAISSGPVIPTPATRRAVLAQWLKGARALVGLIALPPDRRTGLRRQLTTVKTVIWSEPIPLESLRSIARANGATINDLALAALSGALHSQLSGTGSRVRDVRAVLPVNLRSIDPDTVELGNYFGLVFLRLPLSAGAQERIHLIRSRTAKLKKSATPFVTLRLLQIAGRAPRRVVQAMIGAFSAKASVVVTNVPGPSEDLHVAGNRLSGAIAWPPQSGSVGVGVSVISYAGHVVVGLMADELVVPDCALLLKRLSVELATYGSAPGQ